MSKIRRSFDEQIHQASLPHGGMPAVSSFSRGAQLVSYRRYGIAAENILYWQTVPYQTGTKNIPGTSAAISALRVGRPNFRSRAISPRMEPYGTLLSDSHRVRPLE